jgi:hypothetical protein
MLVLFDACEFSYRKGRAARAVAAGSCLIAAGRAAVGRVARPRGDGELLQGFIEDQFKSADVTAIDLPWLRAVPVMKDLGLTSGTFPRHSLPTTARWRPVVSGCDGDTRTAHIADNRSSPSVPAA